MFVRLTTYTCTISAGSVLIRSLFIIWPLIKRFKISHAIDFYNLIMGPGVTEKANRNTGQLLFCNYSSHSSFFPINKETKKKVASGFFVIIQK